MSILNLDISHNNEIDNEEINQVNEIVENKDEIVVENEDVQV